MKLSRLFVGLVLVAAALVALDAQGQAPPLVIEGGTLIDGNGGAPVANAVVVVQGNRITSVTRVGQGAYPPNAQVIDARGKYVLPGLWDAMVSYQWFYGEIMLNHGITSTIDVGIAGEIGAAFRDGVLQGRSVRPGRSPESHACRPTRREARGSRPPSRPAARRSRSTRRDRWCGRSSRGAPTS